VQEQYLLQLHSLQQKGSLLVVLARHLKMPQRQNHANTAMHLLSCALVNCLFMEVNKTGQEGEEVHFDSIFLSNGKK
jgi:hypothetical protein